MEDKCKVFNSIFLNARSIKTISSNCNELLMYKSILAMEKPAIMALNETWLDNTIDDSELFQQGYTCYRKDRLTRGGGLLLCVRDDVISNRRCDLEVQTQYENEFIVCEVRFNLRKCFIVVFYRPPSSTMVFNKNLKDILVNVTGTGAKHILLLGDLNAPHVNWDDMYAPSSVDLDLCNILGEFNLSQLNRCPSRATNNNVLDVVITDSPNIISDITSEISVIKSDHYLLKFNINLSQKRNPYGVTNDRYIYQFKNTNFDEVRYRISQLNLHDIIVSNYNDIDKAWHLWNGEILKTINKLIPKVKMRNNSMTPWIDGEMLHLSNIKETLRRKAKKSNNINDWNNYKQANNKLKNTIRSKYNLFLQDSFDNLDNNPKRFWGLVSSKAKNKKCSVPSEVSFNDKVASDSRIKASFFNQHFHNSFNSNNYPLPNTNVFRNDNLSSLVVTESEVMDILLKLDKNKAYNLEGIPTIIFKECAVELCSSLTLLFNMSLDIGKLPADWKKVDVVPIYKKGDKSLVKNYRPISLMCVASKVLERCVYRYIFPITMNDIDNNQHGFMPGKSTVTNLIEFYDAIYKNLDKKIQSDVIYLDLSKAFDSVPHQLLSLKLQSLGFNGRLLKWFRHYLSNRQQRVLVEGCKSKYMKVLSGVPQGSILGPLLFTYYINDIAKGIEGENLVSMYADDTKLCCKIYDEQCCVRLQECLNNLVKWGDQWGLHFNPDKCKIISFYNGKNKIKFNYVLNNTVLKRVSEFNDLGIIVQENLSWEQQVMNCVKKANKRMGLVKRCLNNDCPSSIKLTCYRSLVSPLLEYGTSVWSSSSKKHIKLIEGVQRRATAYIVDNSNHMSYEERLNVCNILPLSYRREISDCVFLHNNIHNLNFCDLSSIKFYNINTITRTGNRDDLCIIPNRINLTCYQNLYTNNVRFAWNKLPYEIRNSALSMSGKNTAFKKLVKCHYSSMLSDVFDSANICTWVSGCTCSKCKVY